MTKNTEWAEQQRRRQEITAHLACAQVALNPVTGFPPSEKELAQATVHALTAAIRMRHLDGFYAASDIVLEALDGSTSEKDADAPT